MIDDELQQLRNDVRYLKDRADILDCVARIARGHDRHDIELITTCFHDDAFDEHGGTVNAGPDYAQWANEQHDTVFLDHLHNITTHTCEIDGDVAHCESYVVGAMRLRDHKTVSLLGGRYLDRLERRDGAWRIAVRRCTIEWTLAGDTSIISSGAFAGFIQGSQNSDDPSYSRPLTLDTEADRW
jgi:SnoaL-like domain